jgi:hypothetical protein
MHDIVFRLALLPFLLFGSVCLGFGFLFLVYLLFGED